MSMNEKYIQPLPGTVMPCIPVRGSVAFPGITVNLELTRDICKNAFDLANERTASYSSCSSLICHPTGPAKRTFSISERWLK